MNPFKPSGFDTIIGAGVSLSQAEMLIPFGTTTVIEGNVQGPSIRMLAPVMAENASMIERIKGRFGGAMDKTLLAVNGTAKCTDNIEVYNITITGEVEVDTIRCEGTLAIKSGAKIRAREILYRSLVIEDGAVVLGQMSHLDHVSAGETV